MLLPAIRARLAPLVGALGLVALVATNVSAAPVFSAGASVNPRVEYLNNTPGTVFTFTVVNTGDVRIGAVEIGAPSAAWTIMACPSGPPGWTSVQLATKCEFRSASS